MRPQRGGHLGGVYEAVHPEAQKALMKAWLQNPRPDTVELPSCDMVQDFLKLEEDKAGVFNNGTWLPLELHVPNPVPGRVQLPEELDTDLAGMTAYGSCLTDLEVEALCRARGAECECAICRCELKPVSNESATNANPDGGSPVEANPDCSNGSNVGVFQLNCGHAYHSACLEQWFETRRRCPECQKDFGKIIGDQPRTGCLEWHTEQFPLPGHRAEETIVFEFNFPAGTSDAGDCYEGRRPKGYLPGNVQGAILLELFKVAFRRRVMFGLGNSMTTGRYRPTFNIHIKTSTHRGAVGHGYPDDDYFRRSLEELRTNGVTMADLPG